MTMLKRFRRSESGATAIEYGLVLSIIGAFIIGSMTMFQEEVVEMFEMIAETVTTATEG